MTNIIRNTELLYYKHIFKCICFTLYTVQIIQFKQTPRAVDVIIKQGLIVYSQEISHTIGISLNCRFTYY